MADQADVKRVENKLDAIIRLLALPQVQGMKLAEAAEFLDRVGLDRESIAGICRTTPETVRVTLFNLRKAQREAVKPKAKSTKN